MALARAGAKGAVRDAVAAACLITPLLLVLCQVAHLRGGGILRLGSTDHATNVWIWLSILRF